MVAVFTSWEYADLYSQRSDSAWHVGSVFELDAAIAFLTGLSTVDPTGATDHVTRICFDPIDPDGDESMAFEIDQLLEGPERVNE